MPQAKQFQVVGKYTDAKGRHHRPGDLVKLEVDKDGRPTDVLAASRVRPFRGAISVDSLTVDVSAQVDEATKAALDAAAVEAERLVTEAKAQAAQMLTDAQALVDGAKAEAAKIKEDAQGEAAKIVADAGDAAAKIIEDAGKAALAKK